MQKGWFERLEQMISEDSRSMNQISQAAGLGRNFVQQMLKDRKDPGITKLTQVLDALGERAAVYVMTGVRLDSRDMIVLRMLNALDNPTREDALRIVSRLAGQTETQTQEPSLPAADQTRSVEP